jgi:hypothetical protein
MPYCATITPASATEGSDAVFNSLSNPSAVDTSYTFVRQMVLLEVRLHDYKLCNCSCGATTGTVSVPTTDTIDEVNENFSIALELLRLGTIIDNNNALLWLPSPASATEGSDAVFTLH